MNTKNIASNYNINSIQLKLFDSNDFTENLKKKTHSLINENKDLSQVIISDDDYFEYENPKCPYCNSHKIYKEGNRRRIVNFPNKKKHEIKLKKYRCKNCKKYFQTELKGLLGKFKNYTTQFTEKIKETLKLSHQSCRKLSNIFNIFWKSAPSHQTIKNIIKIDENKRIKNPIGIFSGYYSYDEEYLKK